MDPFEREKKIRKGELDHERPSYGELTGWIGRVPISQLPALLCRVVELCERQKVFQEGGLERIVARVVEQCKKPIGLRDE